MGLYAAYTRVSRVGDRSDTLISPRLQQEAIAAWAKAQGHEVEVLEPELDLQGADDARPTMLETIRRVEAGELDGIVVWKFSRFTRKLSSALAFLDRIEAVGGELRSVAEPIDAKTPQGRMSRNIVMSVDQGQREEAAEGFERAKADAIARGVYIAGRVPIGYRKNAERRLEPDPDVAPIIAQLFRWRAGGESWPGLAQWLTDAMGRRFIPGTIRAIIRNPAYLGIARQGRHVNPDAHEPIVDRATWEAAQSEQPRPARSEAPPALLGGLVRCAGCQRTMTAALIRGKRYYRCRRIHTGGICPEPASVNDRIEDYVSELVLSWAAGISDQPAARSDEVEESLRRLEAAEGELLAYQEAIRVAEVGAEVFAAGMRLRRDELEATRRELASARRSAPHVPDSSTLAEAWPAMDVEQRIQVLRGALGVVWVRRSRAALASRVRLIALGHEPAGLSTRGGFNAGGLRSLEWVDCDLPGEIRALGSADVEEPPSEAGP